VCLTAEGGTTGRSPHQAAIRRWIAPQHGRFRVTGTLAGASDPGAALRGRLVCSRTGELNSWTIDQRSQETRVESVELRRGDILDFVVEGQDSLFAWAPHIRLIDVPPGEIAGVECEWKARIDFHGPPRPLSAWEKYAQVLLMANEFAFD
jgi:hypothetical protein